MWNTSSAPSGSSAVAAFTSGTATGLTSLGIRSTGAAFDLTLATSEVLTAGRTLSFNVGDADRVLTISATGTAALLGIAQTFTAANIFSANGAASTPALSLTGSVFTGGSAATTQPLFLIQPTGTSWTNGSTAGTAVGINLASGSTSDLIHGQVDNNTFFKATSGGQLWLSGSVAVSGNGGNTIVYGGGNPIAVFHGGNMNMGGALISWGTNAFGNVSDIGINRLAAGILKVTDGGGGYGIIDASAYRVGSALGIDFSGAVTNITVVKGIVTAAS